MQKTETYQFNLIEGSDAFSQEPINENTKAMEAILAGLPNPRYSHGFPAPG